MPAAWVGAAASVVGAGTALYGATQGGSTGGGNVTPAAGNGLNPFSGPTQDAIREYQKSDPIQYMRNLIQGGGLNPSTFTPGSVQQWMDPSYQWRLNQGMDATKAALAKSGRVMSGNELTALTDYSQGLASTEYGNAFNRALQGFNANETALGNAFNRAGQVQGMVTNQMGNTANMWLTASGQMPAFQNAATGQAQQNMIANALSSAQNQNQIGAYGGAASQLLGAGQRLYSAYANNSGGSSPTYASGDTTTQGPMYQSMVSQGATVNPDGTLSY